MMLSMNRSVPSALVLLGFLCLGCVQLITADEWGTCDRGPDAFAVYITKTIPQTCIDVPFEGEIIERCFYTYVPESCSKEDIAEAPLVVDSHGMSSCAFWQAGYSGWMQKAEEECMVVVWPDGSTDPVVGACFDTPGFLLASDVPGGEDSGLTATIPCCCFGSQADEIKTETIGPLFIKMAIDTTIESFAAGGELSIDTDRVYLTGHSNGCMISFAVAALYSETIAAVACFAGALVTPFPEDYSPVPVWVVHGTEDDDTPYDGGTLFWLPGFGTLGTYSQDLTKNYLAEKNGCAGEEVTDFVDDCKVVGKITKLTNCTNNAPVELVALDGVGHFPFSRGFSAETDIDTTSLAWNFIRSRSNGPSGMIDIVDEEVKVDEECANITKAASAEKLLSIALALPVFLAGLVGDW